MAVPGMRGHLVQTDGSSTFESQTQGGVALGNRSTSSNPLTKAVDLKTNAGDDYAKGTGPREYAGGTFSATVANSSATGAFAYNAAANNKWIIRGITRTLSGASNTSILSGSETTGRKSIHSFYSQVGVGMLAMWRDNRFSFIGHKDDAGSLQDRRITLNDARNAAAAPAEITTNFYDISDGNASDRADDDALPTRAVPGELTVLVNFTNLTGSGQGTNKLDYKAITG